jgi:hypothetical protein
MTARERTVYLDPEDGGRGQGIYSQDHRNEHAFPGNVRLTRKSWL